MTPLTKRQAETLEAIRRLSAGGIAPTYAEIRTAITIVAAKARSIRIVDGW